ncbi:MAG: ATP-binding cassette domain-containing protein [Candidatus Woesearchaeota archaeon]
MEIVKTESISKSFGDYFAVNNVSLSIGSSTIFGLLGPNGAGKTTMIRMLTNIFMPDSGKIYLFGEPTGTHHKSRIGYLPEERGLYKKLKVIEQLIYFAQLKGVPRFEAHSKAIWWLKTLGIEDWATKKVQELSKGMQQKVQFLSTILHNPDLLILDEPFSGFDPINTELLKKIILELKDEGKTIILSTHIMEQVEELCDDICLINKGKIMLAGNLRDIKNSYGRDSISIEFEGNIEFINDYSGIDVINKTENRIDIRLNGNHYLANEILQKAVQNLTLYRFEFSEPSLKEIFIDTVTKAGEKNEYE